MFNKRKEITAAESSNSIFDTINAAVVTPHRYKIRSLLAMLLGCFVLYSFYTESPLNTEILASSVIIGCVLILDEASEKDSIRKNNPLNEGESNDR